MYVPDVLDLFEACEARAEKERRKAPICDYCYEVVQDDHYYDINGDFLCQDCLDHFYRKEVELDG